MLNSGSWSLIIRGSKLVFDEINEKLSLLPSQITKRGEPRSSVLTSNIYDIWQYEIKFDNNSIIESFNELLSNLQSCSEYINVLAKTNDVAIRFYIQSDFAQMGFSITAEMLQRLANLNIKLEVSIFSWGGVEDN
jgi:hypothetical protein